MNKNTSEKLTVILSEKGLIDKRKFREKINK